MATPDWNHRLRERLGARTHHEIASFCRRHGVRELAVFGSVLRDDFRAASDVDFLVSFEPEEKVGFLKLGRMKEELEELLGRPVDLVPKGGVKPLIRDQVYASSELLYAA